MDRLSPDGPVYQAGTLSGNPLAMAAGLAQLRELDRVNGWQRLEELGSLLEVALRPFIKNRPLTFHRIGSMFCLFFTHGPVRNLTDAMRSDRAAFARYFHASLQAGVYFAPSPFETGFISLAHTGQDLEKTAAIVQHTLATLF